MEKGWLIHTKCSNPNHSTDMHPFIENICGRLDNIEMFPNGDFVAHTYGKECVCKPILDDKILTHRAFDKRDDTSQ
jgi:hypothetical protein